MTRISRELRLVYFSSTRTCTNFEGREKNSSSRGFELYGCNEIRRTRNMVIYIIIKYRSYSSASTPAVVGLSSLHYFYYYNIKVI